MHLQSVVMYVFARMVTKHQIIGIAILTICSFGLFVYSQSPNPLADQQRVIPSYDLDIRDKDGRYRGQRDKLSTMLNSVKHELAILSCELIELKAQLNQQTPPVSVSGGWCKDASKSDSGNHVIDTGLARALISLFRDATVSSFGDGPGDYKKYIDASLSVKSFHAYDGAPYSEENSGGAVKFMDLTAPQYGLPVYDWVMSLEVAEHIPPKYEDIYIDNIVRHARVGIVLSWAVPGQGGLSHVNNRPLPYVQKLLSSKYFDVDVDASTKLQNRAKVTWLKRNVFVYRRTGNIPDVDNA